MQTILITGANGNIGRVLCSALQSNYHLRCLDLQRTPNIIDPIVADVNDFPAVCTAMTGVDIAIHLAANPDREQAWQDVYTTGIGGTYHVLEAARQAGVKKVIYASSILVSSLQELQQGLTLTPSRLPQPDSLYGVGKVCGEVLGRMFATEYQMTIICLRIGAFTANNDLKISSEFRRRNWCSGRDLAQLVEKCLQANLSGFHIFYGSSDNTHNQMDISNSRNSIDYQPQDNAELRLEPRSSKILRRIRHKLGKIKRQLIR
jgi:nucleoside-diphosphate-sugar epimerase